VPRETVFAARDRIDEHADRGRAVRDARFKYIRNDRTDAPAAHRSAYRENIEMMRELRERFDAGELDPVQALWFATPRPAEELFDTHLDPDEVVNLADDPAHAADAKRLRRALDAWLTRQGDANPTPEAEMVRRFWPGGTQPVTATPTVSLTAGSAGSARVVARCASDGASIGYRVRGAPDASEWRLYISPFPASSGARVEVKAVRYGWRESEVAELRVP
jgi:N-sulfoglucosamine sulfohydrolase